MVLLIGVYFSNQTPSTSLGSIVAGQAYSATSTNSTYANSIRQIKSQSGTLGSIIVTGTSATVVELRNATSTTDISSTTIATFAASPATGTYTFDSSFSRGLAVVFTGSFVGQYVITYR